MEPASAPPLEDEFVNELECPLCLDILSDPFMYSKCGHNVCKKCCEEIHQLREPLQYNKMQQNTKVIKCPICRTENRICDIVFNRTLSNITKTLRKKNTPSLSASSSTSNLESKTQIPVNAMPLQESSSSSSTETPLGKVEIVIIQAKDLNPVSADGSCDPFVEIVVNGNIVQQTKTEHATVNPTWNEKFQVSLNPKTDRINFKIFHDGKKKALLGEFGLPVHHLPYNEPVSLNVPLYTSNTKGVLYIQVRALNYGMDPKSATQDMNTDVIPRRESDTIRRRQEPLPKSNEDESTLTGSQIGDVVLGVGAVAAGIVGVGALALGSVAAVKSAQRRNSKQQDPECCIM